MDSVVSSKQAHAVEVFDAVDVGTSLWLLGEPSASYTAETVLPPCSTCWNRSVCLSESRFDRDPRFLGSTRMRDFPHPLCAVLVCGFRCSP